MIDPAARTIAAYEAAWNEPKRGQRDRLLAECVSTGVLLSPGYRPDAPELRGRDALSAEIGSMISSRPPGFQLHFDPRVDAHHAWARFGWRVADASGTLLEVNNVKIIGMDLVHYSDERTIDTIVVFIG